MEGKSEKEAILSGLPESGVNLISTVGRVGWH